MKYAFVAYMYLKELEMFTCLYHVSHPNCLLPGHRPQGPCWSLPDVWPLWRSHRSGSPGQSDCWNCSHLGWNCWIIFDCNDVPILYCDKLWLQYTFYSYILYSSLDQKLLLFTLSIQWGEIDKCVLIPSAVIRFEFLRFYRGTSRLDPSTIKKCPHMLRSDHRELRNS